MIETVGNVLMVAVDWKLNWIKRLRCNSFCGIKYSPLLFTAITEASYQKSKCLAPFISSTRYVFKELEYIDQT